MLSLWNLLAIYIHFTCVCGRKTSSTVWASSERQCCVNDSCWCLGSFRRHLKSSRGKAVEQTIEIFGWRQPRKIFTIASISSWESCGQILVGMRIARGGRRMPVQMSAAVKVAVTLLCFLYTHSHIPHGVPGPHRWATYAIPWLQFLVSTEGPIKGIKYVNFKNIAYYIWLHGQVALQKPENKFKSSNRKQLNKQHQGA